jgi:hypothetical protein
MPAPRRLAEVPARFRVAVRLGVSPLRIIVAGMVAQYPVGGIAWDYLQYVIGLAALGHDVFYHEDTWCWPYHPRDNSMTDDASHSAAFLKNFFERYAPELVEHWHYLHLHDSSYGMSRRGFDAVARSADLFINVSGVSFLPDALSPQCLKVFVDTDPGYNQIVLGERPPWSANVERWRAEVLAHDRHFTYGENLGEPDCKVPTVGLRWQKTRMPIVLDLWDEIPLPASPSGAWSTVMTWNVFRGKLEYGGVEYYGKATEFDKIVGLPQQVGLPFRLALGGTEAPTARLAAEGWAVQDGPAVTLTPHDYRDFIAASRGEISVAKNVYVALRTAWFSCRSACYLAAARPVVVQDTGFSRVIPTGRGLHAFTNVEQAAEAICIIERDYGHEASIARELAHAYFDSRRVLTRLIDDALAGPSDRSGAT